MKNKIKNTFEFTINLSIFILCMVGVVLTILISFVIILSPIALLTLIIMALTGINIPLWVFVITTIISFIFILSLIYTNHENKYHEKEDSDVPYFIEGKDK